MMEQLKLPPERYPIYYRWLFAVFVLAMPVAMASSWSVFRDGDVSWQVAAGRWILENGRIPDTDPFSFTMAGQPWVAFEWGSQIIYATAFNIAGHAGLAAVVAAALMALYAIVFVHIRRRAGPAAMLAAFAAMNFVLFPFILARPHVIGWVLMAAWTAILLNYRDKERAPPLALALLMFAWANLHGSFFIGFIIAGAVALDAVIAARWTREALKGWLLFGIASLVAALLNANGLDGFLHPLNVARSETLSEIAEWQPSNPTRMPLFYIVLLGTLGVMLHKQVKLRLGELLLLTFVLAMAFWQMRHQPVFLIISALIVTPALASEAPKNEAPPIRWGKTERAWFAAAVTVALIILTIRLAIPLTPRETFSNPRGLIAHVPTHLRDQPVFNDYSIGGPLILAGIRPYIDGRSDMYGDQFMTEYLKIVNGDEARFDRAVRRYGIRWTILRKGNRLVELLDRNEEWERLYADDVGVIHVRQTPSVSARAPLLQFLTSWEPREDPRLTGRSWK